MSILAEFLLNNFLAHPNSDGWVQQQFQSSTLSISHLAFISIHHYSAWIMWQKHAKYYACQALWLVLARPHHRFAALAGSLLDFPELPVSIYYRAGVGIGSWIFPLRIKISSCLPVWDAPCWPTCWVRCEMCVQALWPYYPPERHECRAGRTHCPHLLISSHPRPLSPLFLALVFHLSSLTPTAKLSACFHSASSPFCTPRWQQIFKENVPFLLLSKQK